jgi:hypothetical protein
MALIENSKQGRKDGGASRLLGSKRLGSIHSRVHSAIISSGYELEKLIFNEVDKTTTINVVNNPNIVDNITNGKAALGKYLCTKKSIKKSEIGALIKEYDSEAHEPDLILFDTENDLCLIIELKDGDAFDTKKMDGEKHSLDTTVRAIGPHTKFKCISKICGFNSTDKDKLVIGFKNRFSKDDILTGEELCEILSIDYGTITKRREHDTYKNRMFYIQEHLEVFADMCKNARVSKFLY